MSAKGRWGIEPARYSGSGWRQVVRNASHYDTKAFDPLTTLRNADPRTPLCQQGPIAADRTARAIAVSGGVLSIRFYLPLRRWGNESDPYQKGWTHLWRRVWFQSEGEDARRSHGWLSQRLLPERKARPVPLGLLIDAWLMRGLRQDHEGGRPPRVRILCLQFGLLRCSRRPPDCSRRSASTVPGSRRWAS